MLLSDCDDIFLLKCCVFDIENGNGLSDLLDLARILLLDRRSLAWRLYDPNTCAVTGLTTAHDAKSLLHVFSYCKN